MKIPKKLKIVGRKIEVIWDKELVTKNDNQGESHYRYDQMIMQPSVKGSPRTEQDMEITFLHELIHFILVAMEETDLKANEKFVGSFTELLYQVLKDNKLKFYK